MKVTGSMGERGKFLSDLLGYQGYTILPLLGRMITLTGFVATWDAPPQTIKSQLSLWLALLHLVYWNTLANKAEGSFWKGFPSLPSPAPNLLVSCCPLSELECTSCEPVLISRTRKSGPSCWDFISIFSLPTSEWREGPNAAFFSPSCVSSQLVPYSMRFLDAWGVLWNHADKIWVKSKIYLILQRNPHIDLYI